MGEILQILSLSLFEKPPIWLVLADAKMIIGEYDACNSLPLLEI